MNARNELADDIQTALGYRHIFIEDDESLTIANRLQAEGWSKRRMVDSIEELEALPHESAVRDAMGDVYEKWSPPDESKTEWMTPGTSWTPDPTLPVTVIYTPEDGS